MKILLFDGPGSSDQSFSMAWYTFNDLLTDSIYTVEKASVEFLLKGGWQESTALLVFGGGYDLGFIQSLKTEGTKMIRDYVVEGGSYLGICAGGYFGCSFIEFDKGGPLEVCGERDLKFYPGGCVGPVLPGFTYDSENGAHAVSVSWDVSNVVDSNQITDRVIETQCYFNGGGYFTTPDPALFDGKILAQYSRLDGKPIAVVGNKVGKGSVVLSGVHFEYDPLLLDSKDPYLKGRKVIQTLMDSTSTTRLGVRSVLKYLRILCK